MRLKYLENPREWRKSAIMTAVGAALVSSILHWRSIMPARIWLWICSACGLFALLAFIRPVWFRTFYRVSLWLGFHSSQLVGRCVLVLFFFLILTPAGIALRLFGKDPLQKGLNRETPSHWSEPPECTPLDRLF